MLGPILPISINFVSLGKWNKYLFTGNWVSTNLFELKIGEPFDALISPDDLGFIFQHKGKGFAVTPKETAIEITIIGLDDIEKKVKLINSVALRLFQLLSHTPIQASGFNVGYYIDLKSNGGKLIEGIRKSIKTFPLDSLETFNIKESNKDYTLNKIVSNISPNGFNLTFNYHYINRHNILSKSFNNHLEYANSLVNII